MAAYYNEIDPYAARWLRNLIAAGHIAPGDVDERSIVDVRPDDLRPYRACHFFAGIGGWARALRLAGWGHDREVWTGSCPCQPLSVAGQRQGHADQRHLWPAFYRLIAECRPATVFGEQVASKDGREWLAAVRADLEASGYAVGAADLPACSVGAPHIRQRLWWVGHAECNGSRRDIRARIEAQGRAPIRSERDGARSSGADAGELADNTLGGWREECSDGGRIAARDRAERRSARFESSGDVDNWPRGSYGDESGHATGCDGGCGRHADCCGGSCCALPDECDGNACVLADAGRMRGWSSIAGIDSATKGRREKDASALGSGNATGELADTEPQHNGSGDAGTRGWTEPANDFWSDIIWLPCTDGKARPTQSPVQLLAYGVSYCLGQLRPGQQEEVMHASEASGLGREVLRAVRQGHDATEVWQSLGRCIGVPKATLLFAALCQHERELGNVIYGAASGVAEVCKDAMRDVRSNGGTGYWPTPRSNDNVQTNLEEIAEQGLSWLGQGRGATVATIAALTTCPPSGWQLPQQCALEFADAVHSLSLGFASLNRFTGPLAVNVPARVGRLRAYGNAIVPQVAAEFIKAASP